MSIIALIAALAAGWFGWTRWLAIPLGFLLYWVTHREEPERAARVAHAAWLVAPLIALAIMSLGRIARTLFT